MYVKTIKLSCKTMEMAKSHRLAMRKIVFIVEAYFDTTGMRKDIPGMYNNNTDDQKFVKNILIYVLPKKTAIHLLYLRK